MWTGRQTYGENSQQMRESMAWLLGRHRILQQLGGPGSHTIKVWSTDAEGERMGQIIQRYRLATLTWCLQAVTAATPKTDLSGTTGRSRTPVEDLRYRLDEAVTAVGHREPMSDLLTSPHTNELMDAWQRLARAAALGEYDLGAGMNLGHLTPAQSRTVLKDPADLTRALLILDRRYKNIPGWHHFKESTRIGRAAEATSLIVDHERRHLAVDQRGWQPVAGVIDGPPLPGVAGAVQAQNNMLVDLARFPNALNLRRVCTPRPRYPTKPPFAPSQRPPTCSSRSATARCCTAISSALAATSVASSVVAATRWSKAKTPHRASNEPPPARSERGELHGPAKLFTRTDVRVAVTIEHGFNEKLYFVSVNYPRLMDEQVNGVHPNCQRWMPVTSSVQTPMLGLVREQLRPPPVPSTPAPGSLENRTAYEAVVTQEFGRVGHARSSR